MLECEYLLDDNSPFRFKIPKYKNIIGDTSPTKEIPGYEPSEDNGVVGETPIKEKQDQIPEEESKALLPTELDNKLHTERENEEYKKNEEEDKKENLPSEDVEDKKKDITPEGDNSNLPQEQEKKENVENEYKDEEMYVDDEEKPEQKVDENNNDLPAEEEKKEENIQSEEGINENISEKNETKYTGNFY